MHHKSIRSKALYMLNVHECVHTDMYSEFIYLFFDRLLEIRLSKCWICMNVCTQVCVMNSSERKLSVCWMCDCMHAGMHHNSFRRHMQVYIITSIRESLHVVCLNGCFYACMTSVVKAGFFSFSDKQRHFLCLISFCFTAMIIF